jgi:hypothetical protein
VLPTVATALLEELHIPSVDVSESVVVELTHAVALPVIAAGVDGKGLTVTTANAAELPQPFVTV